MEEANTLIWPPKIEKFPAMFCERNESVANFHWRLVAIQLQIIYHTFISIRLQNRYCFATDLSIAKFLLQIKIFLVVNENQI